MGGLFGGGGPSFHSEDPIIAAMRINTSAYGKAIALVYGKARVAGNLVWYDDFTATPHTTTQSGGGGKGGGGGGGSSSQTSYTYSAAAIMGLCEGVIGSVGRIWAGKTQYADKVVPAQTVSTYEIYTIPSGATPTITVTNAAQFLSNIRAGYHATMPYGEIIMGMSQTNGTPGPSQYNVVNGVYTFNSADAGVSVEIQYYYTIPSHIDSPATQLGLSVYSGTASQTAFGYVASKHPNESLAYRRLAYVATGAYDLGDNASLPNHTFEVDALLPFSSSIRDALPPDVMVDYLTDAYHGAGFPSSKIGDMSAWTTYCKAAGLFVSPVYSAQEQASEAMARLFMCGNAAPFFSEGKLKVVPYGDTSITGNGVTFTPINTARYDLTDDDFISDGGDPVIVLRGNPADAFNQVQVKYSNRANQYNNDVVEAKDQANIELMGLRPMSPVDMKDICLSDVARNVAQIALQRSLYLRNIYRFKLGWKYCLLEPMDIVTLTESAGTGLSGQAVRITAVEENDDGTFSFEAEDYIGGISTAVTYPTQPAGGYAANFNVSPGSVNAPIIFDAPGRLTSTGYEVWMAVAGSDANWGGANVWVSTDGVTYSMVGSVASRSRFGYLTATFAAGSDPDTSNAALVDLTTSKGALATATADDADLNNTLCWCDGELFSYTSAVLSAPYKYTLGARLRRGVFGTPISSHAAGKGFVRLDGNIARYAYDTSMIGKQVWVKFASFNVYGGGNEGLAGLTAYTFTIGGPIGAPADVTGGSATATADGILLNWTASTSPNLAQYEIRQGASWDSAVFVGKSLTTRLLVPAVSAGTTTWLVKAIDTSGRFSLNAATIAITVSAPTAPTVTAQVIDNNVLLFWTASAGTQPIQTYEVRKGATWAGGAVVGTKAGLFTNLSETTSGTYTYWVAAVDIGGNYGTPASTTANVSAPPDYVLKASINSTFSGTKSSAILELGSVVMPVNTTETFAAHFTSRSWASPQDQINAGYPLFIEPATTSGYYEEVIDYGATLSSCKVTASFAGTVLAGAITTDCTITVAQDAGFTTGVQTFSGATQAYGTNFRYVKVRITATGAGGANLYRLDSLNVRLDVKLKNDAGTVTWNGNPATASFNIPFINVQSINLTVMGSTGSIVPVTDFVSVANPTTFKVYLFNSTTGSAPTGPITVAWSAKGY